MSDAANDDIRSIFAAIQEINIKIARLPTREDLASHVSKEVYNEKIGAMQDDINDLKERLNGTWNKNIGLISVICSIICACFIALQFIVTNWR